MKKILIFLFIIISFNLKSQILDTQTLIKDYIIMNNYSSVDSVKINLEFDNILADLEYKAENDFITDFVWNIERYLLVSEFSIDNLKQILENNDKLVYHYGKVTLSNKFILEKILTEYFCVSIYGLNYRLYGLNFALQSFNSNSLTSTQKIYWEALKDEIMCNKFNFDSIYQKYKKLKNVL